ncbi:sigma 54-interacting transcriptional regulator [bacterium]|nr:sigma 54-interacting transcriptional regulator [bacterium]
MPAPNTSRAWIEIRDDRRRVVTLALSAEGVTVGGGSNADITLPELSERTLVRAQPGDGAVELTLLAGPDERWGKFVSASAGERVTLGPYALLIGAPKKTKKDPTRELVLRAGGDALVVNAPYLVVRAPENGPERRVEIPEGGLVIGKNPECDLVLTDTYVSGRHAMIEARAGRLTLRDLASRNGTFLDGARVEASEIGQGQEIVLGRTSIRVASERTEEAIEPAPPIPGLAGESATMRRVAAVARRVAATDVTVLLTGETGTGKEVVARAIHRLSPRADGPFIPVNCGAIPKELIESELFGHVRGAFSGANADRKGLFPLAAGGTIFLDEIGELPPDAQTRLLRVLDDGHVRPLGAEREIFCDARVVAATNRDLSILAGDGKFREDLLYRLRMIEIALPPLRERGEDIPAIARHLLEREAAALGRSNPGFTSEALARLRAYDFPGNVREMRAALVHALVMTDVGPIDAADLVFVRGAAAPRDPDRTEQSRAEQSRDRQGAGGPARAGTELNPQSSILDPPSPLESAERDAILRALAHAPTRKAAARTLGIAPSTLYQKIRKYGLEDR